jgi:hypothetical protein
MYARLHFNQISSAAVATFPIFGFSVSTIFVPLGNASGGFLAVWTFRRSSFSHWLHLGIEMTQRYIKVSMDRATAG